MQTSYIQLLDGINRHRIETLSCMKYSPTSQVRDLYTLLIERLDMIEAEIHKIFKLSDAEKMEEQEELIRNSKRAFQEKWKCENGYKPDPIFKLSMNDYDNEALCELYIILAGIQDDPDIWISVGGIEFFYDD